jgi:hypothetical protein
MENDVMVQLGQYRVPQSNIHHIDEYCQQTPTEGGSVCVRVWFRQPYGAALGSTPANFLDFTGNNATQIRTRLASTPSLILLPSRTTPKGQGQGEGEGTEKQQPARQQHAKRKAA